MNYMYETWRDVIDYEGLYEVSNRGRVRSWFFKGKKREIPLILSNDETKKGYLRVCLTKDRKEKRPFIHRLVVEAFILGRKMREGEFCDHINTIKTDNRVENLRVCSHKENMNNPLTRKKIGESKKGKTYAAKLLTLRGVNDASIYRFKTSVDASRFFDYKNESQIAHYISKARKADKRTIKIRDEEYYFSQSEL